MIRLNGLRTLLAIVTLLLGQLALASTYRLLGLQELVAAAELAVHGTVTSSEPLLLDGEPWTRVVIEVITVLADTDEGRMQQGELTLDFLGGSVGGEQLSVALMPQFTPGDEVLLLAYQEPYYSPIVGFNQGLWRLSGQGEWLDDTGASLGLTDDGELQRGESALSSEEVVAALATLLEDR